MIDSMVREYQVERVREVRELGIDPATIVPERYLRTALPPKEKEPARTVVRKPAEKKTEQAAAPKTSVPASPEVEEKNAGTGGGAKGGHARSADGGSCGVQRKEKERDLR